MCLPTHKQARRRQRPTIRLPPANEAAAQTSLPCDVASAAPNAAKIVPCASAEPKRTQLMQAVDVSSAAN
jgi:hypothetical protein